MSASIHHGRHTWKVSTDAEGYRTYHLTTYVSTSDPLDGPLIARNCAGLPQPGSWWAFGNDFDDWVWCRWTNQVSALQDGEPCQEWRVEQEFSNRPEKETRCNSNPINDPLLEPMKISGSFNKYSEEASFDRFGLPIVTSSWEQIRGPQVEFDANRTTVCIEQNVASLQLPVLDALKNTVNDATLWNMPRRCVKLSSITWSRQYYGSCYPYFRRRFEFDVSARIDPVSLAVVSGFDRDVLDEGSKALNGHYDNRVGVGGGDWVLDKIANVIAPDPYNQTHFSEYRDRKGNTGRVLLNGRGLPAGVTVRAAKTLYISRTDVHTANDVGDTTKWLKLTTDPANRPAWTAVTWSTGSLVNFGAGVFLCDPQNTGAPSNVSPPATPWLLISTVTNKGDYDTTSTAYAEGDYVAVQGEASPSYMSRVAAASHAAQDINNSAKWLKLRTSPSSPVIFTPPNTTVYPQGTLVTFSGGGSVYLCIAAAGTSLNPTTVDGAAVWLIVTPASKGVYDGTANYTVGDYVTLPAATAITAQGRIHIEKYDEGNFLLLGIPTVLA